MKKIIRPGNFNFTFNFQLMIINLVFKNKKNYCLLYFSISIKTVHYTIIFTFYTIIKKIMVKEAKKGVKSKNNGVKRLISFKLFFKIYIYKYIKKIK